MLCMNVLAPKLMLQMSYIPDQHQPPQWTKSEQLALLTTILKDMDPDPAGALFHLIQQRGLQPRWQDIPLPEGRSVNSCISVYEEMRRRSASSSVGQPGYAIAPVLYTAQQPLGPLMPRKRSYNDQETQSHTQRMLQPKPPRSVDSPLPSATPVTNGGESFTFVPRASPIDAPVVKPPPKKRGRPNKDELDRRRAEAEAKGEVYPDPTKRKRQRQSEVKSESSPAASNPFREEQQRSFSAQTPRRQSPEIPERSSSGKRRRLKQRDRDSDAINADEDDSIVMNIPIEAQSPSERLLMKGASSSRSPAASRDVQQGDAAASVGGLEQRLESAGPSDR